LKKELQSGDEFIFSEWLSPTNLDERGHTNGKSREANFTQQERGRRPRMLGGEAKSAIADVLKNGVNRRAVLLKG
jgi:hypothetical protein